MDKRSVSSKDVAAMAGVSRTTVSFVLNATPGKVIPEETRARVLAAAAELGYEPDPRAAELAKSARHTVALVVRHASSIYSDAYILRLIEGIAPVLNRRRCSLALVPCGGSASGVEMAALARAAGADGALVTNTLEDDAGLPGLAAAGIPAVVVGTVRGGAWQIDIDNREAARGLCDYLVGLGHRRIAAIAHAPERYYAASERLAGYREALESAGLSFDKELVRVGNFSEESGRVAMAELLALRPRPSAVFAGNDAIAYGALQAAREAGAAVPADISIAGFDDDFPSRFVVPPLTSVTLPAAALGEKAAEMIVDLIEGREPAERLITLTTKLAIRASCAPPASP